MNSGNWIGYTASSLGNNKISSVNPKTQKKLTELFIEVTPSEVDLACEKAHHAWKIMRTMDGKQKHMFLSCIADEIEGLGDKLIYRAMAESGLPEGRIRGERGRTCGQLRLFADVARKGHWVDARIDHAIPDRQPVPKPDIRKMLQSIGPVAVFGASNFPLAFSTAGGDTASAFAAGCPVIVKAHPSHLGTHAMISDAIQNAAKKCNMPDGTFSSLIAVDYRHGIQLVTHKAIKAVAFTGSFQGGMAIYKAAQAREEPIPVFAEMGSVNPVFLLPEKLREEFPSLAQTLASSVNLGAGQFCTNPGIIVLMETKHSDTFLEKLATAFSNLTPATMLNKQIYKSYTESLENRLKSKFIQTDYAGPNKGGAECLGTPALASVSAKDFLRQPSLKEELFGPFTLVVKCKSSLELENVANAFQGQLTASIFAKNSELSNYSKLISILEERVGRLIYNSVPTGVEVCHSMQHGGPFPASTDSRFTSVGTSAITRFARPISFQDCPNDYLPDALKEENPLQVHRFVDGEYSSE